MDGRDFPDVPLGTWMGYSIGRYEGDALVVETRQFRGWEEGAQRWLDRLGHPFSDELKVTERFRRTSRDTLVNEITIDDPGAYTQPWSSGWELRWVGGEELPVYFCQDNRS